LAKALNTMIQSGGGLLKSAKSAFDQENEDELKKASKQQGILTPTSPLGASSLGVSPDSQKMAGTGQQKMGISQQIANLASDNSLAPKEATEQEKQKRGQAEKLQKMGQAGTGLKDRVNSIILGDIQKKTTEISGDAGVTNSINRVVTGSGVDAPNQARIQKLLSGQELDSDVEYEELGKALGITNVTGKALSDTLNSKYLVTTSGKLPFELQKNLTVSDVAAVNSDNDANTDWVQELKLGFNNESDLIEFLGIKPADMAGLTVAQLNEQVDNKVAKNFSEIAAAQARMNDPAASMQEKTAARELLTGLGQAGVLGSEQLAQGSTRDTKKANTVTFMGQEWKPEDLAIDPIFQSKSNEYYKGTPEQRRAIRDAAKSASDKAFYDFLDANEKTLKSIQTTSGATLSKVDKDLEEAKKGWEIPTFDAGINEKLMGQAAPKKIGQKIDDGKITKAGRLVKSLSNLALAGDQKAAKQVEILNNFYKTQMPANIEMDVMGKSLLDLQNAGIWDENPDTLRDNLKNWSLSIQDQKFLENKDMNWQEMSQVFGLSHDEAQELAKNLKSLSSINPELSGILDANKDGVVDAPLNEVKKRLTDKYGASTKAWKPGQKLFGDDLREMVAKAKEAINKIPDFLRDGEASGQDLLKWGEANPNGGFADYDSMFKDVNVEQGGKDAIFYRIAENEIKKVLPNAQDFLSPNFANPIEDTATMQNGHSMLIDALSRLNGMQMDPRGQPQLDELKAALKMKIAAVGSVLEDRRLDAQIAEAKTGEEARAQRERDREAKKKQLANLGYAPEEIQTIIDTGILPVLKPLQQAVDSGGGKLVSGGNKIVSGVGKASNKVFGK